MDGLPFSVLSTIIQLKSDNEKLCAMESCLQLNWYPTPAGLEPGTARYARQR